MTRTSTTTDTDPAAIAVTPAFGPLPPLLVTARPAVRSRALIRGIRRTRSRFLPRHSW